MSETPIFDELAAEQDEDILAAQDRDVDPDGDPDAQDPGDCEPAEMTTDPNLPFPNPDAHDPLDDVDEGEDLGDDVLADDDGSDDE
jgi:hypothetical protein